MTDLVNSLWVVVSAALVFFMQPGFSMVESGLTREKNSINVAIKNLTDIGISVLMYWFLGFGLMFGTSSSGIIGTSGFMPGFNGNIPLTFGTFLLFQAMFCSTSATIVSGAVAERMKYSSYIITTLVISAVIYPVFGHWAWGGLQPAEVAQGTGWLAKLGFVDFAGSTVVHSVGGYVGLAGIIILGARKGKFREDGTAREIQGSNIPMAVAGVFILWFGWIGFNGGSTLGFTSDVPSIILNTCIAAASGMIFALAAGWITAGIPNVNFVLNGTLAGLVAITASCHCVTAFQSFIIGGIGGLVMLVVSRLLEKCHLDDAVGAVPVHLAAGIWGTLAVGIFGDSVRLGTNPIVGSQLLAQAIGVVVCGVWAFGSAFLVLSILNKIVPLRVSRDDEDKGLNIAEHGASTEIFDLYSIMGEQSQTGDMSLRLPVEPFTEVGQIAALYNKVMDKLEESTLERDSFDAIFNSVNYAMFLIDPDYTVCPQYSKVTARLLCCAEPAGYSFPLLMARILTPEKTQALDKFLKALFDTNYKKSTLASMNPLQKMEVILRRKTGDENSPSVVEKRIMEFQFTRIYNKQHTKVLHAVVCARGNYS